MSGGLDDLCYSLVLHGRRGCVRMVTMIVRGTSDGRRVRDRPTRLMRSLGRIEQNKVLIQKLLLLRWLRGCCRQAG